MLFEAQMAPHIFFWNDIGDRLRSGESGPVFTFSFSPMVRLRMLTTDSNPVRTPSYMPKVDFQFFWVKMAYREAISSGGNVIENLDGAHIVGTTVTAGHHSNGQDGCLFGSSELIDGDSDCLTDDIDLADPDWKSLNKKNGSFSTDYLAVAAHYRYDSLVDVKDDFRQVKQSFGATLRYEYHPPWFPSWLGAIEEPLQTLYGMHKLGVHGEYSRHVTFSADSDCAFLRAGGLLKAVVAADFSLDSGKGVPWHRVHVEGSLSTDYLGGWGLFVRYVNGQDHYNLSFHESLSHLYLGFIFHFGAPEKYDYSN